MWVYDERGSKKKGRGEGTRGEGEKGVWVFDGREGKKGKEGRRKCRCVMDGKGEG